MKNILIIHHGDADGLCSAGLAYKFFHTIHSAGMLHFDFHQMNYDRVFPFDKFDMADYDEVLMLDFSLQHPGEMKKTRLFLYREQYRFYLD